MTASQILFAIIAGLKSLMVFLAILAGGIYATYRAIRCFMEKRIRMGMVLLLPGLVVVFVVFGVLCAVHGARQLSQQGNCNNNLKEITLYTMEFQNDHHETRPASFNDLNDTNYISQSRSSVFICPGTHHEAGALTNIQEWTDYAYVSGLPANAPANCVLAFCLPECHRGEGANVASVDGQISWFPREPYKDSAGTVHPSFRELTNDPTLFYGTTNEVVLADLKKRTRIIWPQKMMK